MHISGLAPANNISMQEQHEQWILYLMACGSVYLALSSIPCNCYKRLCSIQNLCPVNNVTVVNVY